MQILKIAVFAAVLSGLCFFPGSAQDMEVFLLSLPDGIPGPAPQEHDERLVNHPAGGPELFKFLHETAAPSIPDSGDAYLKAKKYMFSVADNAGCAGSPGVMEFYSKVCVPGSSQYGSDYRENGDQNGDGVVDSEGMNAEHSWPQGFFNQEHPMRADLHHVFPTFMTINNVRGSAPFAMVSKPWYSTSNGTGRGYEGFEPADSIKGDIARAMLYFVLIYYDRNIRDGADYDYFWKNRVRMFLEWNRFDPPDAAEKRRNDLIAGYQGNRNPFVDDFTLPDRIGAEVFMSH
ncbi:MAG: endonuclease [Elusimicrobia bacterium]|nr:endonuclease [Elusimicrobiota bacterium]